MPRNRSKPEPKDTRPRVETRDDGVVTVYPQSVSLRSEVMTDSNNGRLRPNSNVTHSKCYYFPQPRPTYRKFGGLYWYTVRDELPFRSASGMRSFFDSLVAQESAEAYKIIKRRAYDSLASFGDRKNLLNFFWELRELPTMFKKLNKYRFIDWQFGWKPFLSDLSELLGNYEAALERAKEKIEQNSKPQPVEFHKKIKFNLSNNITYAVADASFTQVSATGYVKFNGIYRVMFPDIQIPYNMQRLRLDLQGWNLDPATIWEAIPFSWLVDWFIPIGNSLEGLSGSNFNPKVYLTGTISVKVKLTYELSKPGWPQGGGTYSYYSREAFGDSFDSINAETPVFRVPIPDPTKAGILNDIFGVGSSADDAKKLARHGRGRMR